LPGIVRTALSVFSPVDSSQAFQGLLLPAGEEFG
jgi:hypothetical protein